MSNNSKRHITVEPIGGLGNRIFVLNATIQLAKKLGMDYIKIRWCNNDECGCDYEDVLEPIEFPCTVKNYHYIKESYKSALKRGRLDSVILKLIQSSMFRIRMIYIRRKLLDVSEPFVSDETRLAYITKRNVRNPYIRTFRDYYGSPGCEGVPIKQAIWDRADDMIREINANISHHYVAMHIRRTDNENAIKLSPTWCFEKKLEDIVNENQNVRIYLATDDQGLYNLLKERYPKQILKRTIKADRTTRSGMISAAVELCILANAEKLYGTDYSSFSNLAHLYGRNAYEVIGNNE